MNMAGWMDGWMHVRTYVRTYVCMYICIYILKCKCVYIYMNMAGWRDGWMEGCMLHCAILSRACTDFGRYVAEDLSYSRQLMLRYKTFCCTRADS